jgi:hypothetical protein
MQGSVGLACPYATSDTARDMHNIPSAPPSSLLAVCCIQLTTVDQQTAVVGKEPLETLHTFRTGLGLGWAEAAGRLPVQLHCEQLCCISCTSSLAMPCKLSVLNLGSAATHAGLKSWKHAVFFGNNLVTQQSSGTVTVGDAVRVTMLRGTSQDGALVWKDLTK